MSVKIYHNPRCKKSRETLNLLVEKGINTEVVEYLKTPPSKDELRQVVELLEIKPHDLIRVNEQIYKDNYKGKDLSDDEWLEAMVNNPKLIQRPIVIHANKAAIGRPPENVLKVIE